MSKRFEADAQAMLEVGRPYRLVRARHGLMLANPNDEYLGKAITTYGECCELETVLLRQLLQRPGRIVEVGANAGLLTLPLARAAAARGSTLEAFEPQQFLFQNLCANLALNGIANVRAWPFACGDVAGEVRFGAPDYETPGNFGSVSVAKPEDATASDTLSAPCVRLDDVLGPAPVGLLKVDVEGYELRVLQGAAVMLAAMRPVVYVENDRPALSPALIEYLWSQNYRLWWHAPPLFNPDNYFGQVANIYGSIVSLNMIGLPREFEINVEGAQEILNSLSHPLMSSA